MLFDKFENEIIITGEIETIDPLHIGASGKNSLSPIDIDDAVLKDSRGLPLIPGSSLKGAVRSRFEAVMKSLNKRVCDFSDKNSNDCITENDAKNIRNDKNLSDEQKALTIYEKSCDVCRLFGGREIGGRIYFKDCYFKGESINYEYRDGIRIDRETGAAASAAKFDYEIVPKGAVFDFYLKACNLDNQQIKYINFIIRELEGGNLSVGGKTTRGLGRIKLTVDECCRNENGKLNIKTADDYRKEFEL